MLVKGGVLTVQAPLANISSAVVRRGARPVITRDGTDVVADLGYEKIVRTKGGASVHDRNRGGSSGLSTDTCRVHAVAANSSTEYP
jgi:hypothetical protein